MVINSKTPLRELGRSDVQCRASKGNYRACVIIDDIISQIGEDVADRDHALSYCAEYINDGAGVQIFNDHGAEQIVRGELEKVVEPNDDDGFGNQPYRNEIPPIQWQKVI